MNIRKIIAGILAFSLVFGSVSYYNSIMSIRGITSNAEENTNYIEGPYESLSYKKYSDHIEISGCDTSVTDVVIPDEIEGLPVTVIGDSAFANCSISSIGIPKSVTYIGYSAFANCGNLFAIVLVNTECTLSSGFVSSNVLIYGYENSTAQEYANNYGNIFVAIDSLATTTTSTTTTPLITTTTTTPLITTAKKATTKMTTATTYKIATWTAARTTTTTTPKALVILPKTASIRVNDNKELTILNCSNPEELKWISSNDEVATVEDGKIIGLSKGTATIYAVKGDLYGEVLVDVNEEISSGDEPLKGDINGDGVIDASDSSAILAYYAYKSSGGELSLEAFMNLE